MKDIKEINGHEILDFLNHKLKEQDDKLVDVSICETLELTEQEFSEEKYILTFSGYFNNWGTYQLIEDNYLIIDKDCSVSFELNEPFDGDGSNESLAEIVSEWIKDFEFDVFTEEKFYLEMENVYEQLPQISFESKNEMDKIITDLERIKTYMK